MGLRRAVLLCSVVLLAAAPAFALEPYLVKDINPIAINPGSNPRELTTLDNGVALFLADSSYRPELWRSDGTAAGTYQLSEPICEGLICEQKRLRIFAHAGGRLFFLPGHYQDNGSLRGLSITDGTKPGTFPLADPFVFPSHEPPVWVKSRGLLFFGAAELLRGEQKLWRSDGTPGGTYPLSDLWGGSSGLTEFRGKLYFGNSDSLHGLSLWVSDGSAAGTKSLKDLDPSSPSLGNPLLLRSIGSVLVFFDGSLTSLWRSDGTARGTVPIARFPRVSAPYPRYYPYVTGVTSLNGRYYFGLAKDDRGEELWVSDGTISGTRQLTNFALHDALSHSPGDWIPLPTRSAGARVIFLAGDDQHGHEPWVTDGTPKGTRLLRDLCPGRCSSSASVVASFGSRLILRASDSAHGAELWITDGTPAGTRLIRDICRGSCSSRARGLWELGDKLLFEAFDLLHGPEIWRSDGTPRGTVRVTDWPSAFVGIGSGIPIPEALLFSADQSTEGHELWRTDGTAQGTYLLRDIADQDQGGSTPFPVLATADRLYFYADDGLPGGQLWASDGTEAGTVPVHELSQPAGRPLAIASGFLFALQSVNKELELWRMSPTGADAVLLAVLGQQGIDPPRIESAGNRIFVQNGGELWTSDGAPSGTHKLAPPFGGAMATLPGRLVFSAGGDLWTSDGDHTTLLLAFPSGSSGLRFLGEHGGQLWFEGPRPGSVDRSARSLWSTDGTSHGTMARTDFPIGMEGAEISLLISAGSRMFLTAAGSGSGKGGLWISDGTAAGTRRISSSVLAGYISDKPAVVGGSLFYWHWDGEATSLGRSDGTEAGTGLVLDASGEKIVQDVWKDLAAAGDNVYFIRNGELWRTDGSPTGTMKVGARFPERLTPAGGRLFFSAWDPATGRELWAVDPQ